jgi:hypothetical protein
MVFLGIMSGRYLLDEQKLVKKEEDSRKKQMLRDEANRLRKERELKRRKKYAELYEPHACIFDDPSGQPCTRFAIPGGFFCIRHGGNTHEAREAAKMRLLALVEPALVALNRALAAEDLSVATKAAMVILDRAGFGPKATLVNEQQAQDLSSLSKNDLMERGQAILKRIEQMHHEEKKKELPEITIEEIPVNPDESVH